MTSTGNAPHEVVLRSDELELRIRLQLGADLVTLADARSGDPWLLVTPWAGQPDAEFDTADPQSGWLREFRGGWQLLTPNAGAARQTAGTTWPFHGSTSRSPWTVPVIDGSSATFAIDVPDAPLHLRRTVTVEGGDVVVTTTTTNTGTLDLDVHHVEHITFGPPLLEPGCRLRSNAGKLTLDPDAHGPDLAGGTRWPHVARRHGPPVAVDDLLGADPASAYGWLSDFADQDAYVEVVAAGSERAVRVEWAVADLPYAWLWVENGASTAAPWSGRARALGVEPANVPTRARDRPGVTSVAPLAGGATRTARVTVRTGRGAAVT